MKVKVLLAAAAVLSLGVGVADAAPKHKRNKPTVHRPAGLYVPPQPYATRTPGPPWAGPAECYTDEGYGRYAACGAGRSE
jgi:hypothetical protein